MKLLFARNPARLDAVAVNTSGGLTGGDRLRLKVTAGPDTQVSVTTQAAERAYRASAGTANVETELHVEADAQLLWLPQELILFDGAALSRRLHCDLAQGARFLMVEPVVFGRSAMGETIKDLTFRDQIEIDRAGRPLYRDTTTLQGDMVAHLQRRGVAQGAGAMASLLYVAPDAEAQRDWITQALPTRGGASLLAPDVLALRMLAADGFELRKSLLPILDHLTENTLPASWRL